MNTDPDWLPQTRVLGSGNLNAVDFLESWVLGFKDITAPTNERTFIASLLSRCRRRLGNKVPILMPDTG